MKYSGPLISGKTSQYREFYVEVNCLTNDSPSYTGTIVRQTMLQNKALVMYYGFTEISHFAARLYEI